MIVFVLEITDQRKHDIAQEIADRTGFTMFRFSDKMNKSTPCSHVWSDLYRSIEINTQRDYVVSLNVRLGRFPSFVALPRIQSRKPLIILQDLYTPEVQKQRVFNLQNMANPSRISMLCVASSQKSYKTAKEMYDRVDLLYSDEKKVDILLKDIEYVNKQRKFKTKFLDKKNKK